MTGTEYGCSLAFDHGGPHYDNGIWWFEQPDPPDWRPPRYAVMVTARNHDQVLQFNVVIDSGGRTLYALGPPWDLELTFSTIRVP